MYILGVNAGPATFHDASACVVDGEGRVLAFIEEERLSRVRHAPGAMPVLAVAHCLRVAGISWSDVDVVATGWDIPRMSARWGEEWKFPSAIDFLRALGLPRNERSPDLQFVPHHRAHAASAFHASAKQVAGVLVVDGNGEDESISIFRAERGKPMVRLRRWARSTSLGYMYDSVSDFLGLGLLNAGKTMGLAAYGRQSGVADPGWINVEGGELRSAVGDDELIGYRTLMPLWREVLRNYADGDISTPDSELLHEDAAAVKLAWAAQANVESILPWLVEETRRLVGVDDVCIAGGVGLNCAANGRLPGSVFVPPVPHDGGVSLGAAWFVAQPAAATVFSAYTGGAPGPATKDQDIGKVTDIDIDKIAEALAAGLVGAICRGPSEVGPRALGHRSILASPSSADMQNRLNVMKDRERWRPFGPVTNVPLDEAAPWWDGGGELERYMVGASSVSARGHAELPAVTHVDGTTRPQRLARRDEPVLDGVLSALGSIGHPQALVNTSLNGRGEPLVETADEALSCAARIGLDFIIVNDDVHLISRESKRSSLS